MSDVFAAMSDYKAKQKLARELLAQKEEVGKEYQRINSLHEKAAREAWSAEKTLLNALHEDA